MASRSKSTGTKTIGGKTYTQSRPGGVWVESGSSKSSGGSSKSSGSSSKSSGSSRGTSSSKGYGGATKTQGGKTYVQGKNGMWFDTASDTGKRIQSEYSSSGSGGSSGGSTGNKPTSGGKTTGGNNGGWGPGGNPTAKAYSGGEYARLKNGMLVTGKDIQRMQERGYELYDPTYRATNYQSTVGEDGNIYNHLGQKWGDPNSAWTYSELPDEAKARVDWNYGVGPGESHPNTPGYNSAYDWYNDTFGVAGDDTHPLSAGKAVGGGSYWANGGDGYNTPKYKPAAYTYSAPDGNGGWRLWGAEEDDANTQTNVLGNAVAGGGATFGVSSGARGKLNPSTGYSPDTSLMNDYKRALREAEERDAEALAAQMEAALAQLNAQRDPLQQQYTQSAQQAYIARELAKQQLPEQLAAQGIGGGASESANLALETTYGNSLNDLTNRYNDYLADLELQESQLRSQGDLQQAQTASEYSRMLAQALMQARQQEAERQWQAQQQAQQWAWQAQQADRDFERQKDPMAYQKSLGGGGSSGLTLNQRLSALQAQWRDTQDPRYAAEIDRLLKVPEGTTENALPAEVQRIINFANDGTMTPLEAQRHLANMGWSVEGLFD